MSAVVRFCRTQFEAKVSGPVKRVCQQQLSSVVLLASFVAGVVGGVWPVPLTTWMPCTALNYVYGGHIVLTQTLNLLLTPVNLATVIPFKQLGEWILGVDPIDLSISELRSNALEVLKNSPWALAHAAAGWCLFCLASTVLFFVVLKPLAWCLTRRRQGTSGQIVFQSTNASRSRKVSSKDAMQPMEVGSSTPIK